MRECAAAVLTTRRPFRCPSSPKSKWAHLSAENKKKEKEKTKTTKCHFQFFPFIFSPPLTFFFFLQYFLFAMLNIFNFIAFSFFFVFFIFLLMFPWSTVKVQLAAHVEGAQVVEMAADQPQSRQAHRGARDVQLLYHRVMSAAGEKGRGEKIN